MFFDLIFSKRSLNSLHNINTTMVCVIKLGHIYQYGCKLRLFEESEKRVNLQTEFVIHVYTRSKPFTRHFDLDIN